MAAVYTIRRFNNLPRAVLAALFIGPLLSGCLGSDSNNDGNDTSTGTINALGISGLSYQTASQSGKTGINGKFSYYPGETLSLKVGDLQLADGVPAQEWVTLLDFFPDIRTQLSTPTTDEEGLRTHKITERQALNSIPLTNMTRFLLALNWSETPQKGRGIEIRDRVIQQLNKTWRELKKADDSIELDFTVSEAEFSATGDTPSIANTLLSSICFYPEGSELCEDPPTLKEIEMADERPENPDDWRPDAVYKQDLEAKRSRILDSVRSLDNIDAEDARQYLMRELDSITTAIGKRFYLDHHTARVPTSDTGIKQFKIRRIGGSANLAYIDAITTRPQDVVLHSYTAQTGQVEYFVDGPAGGESEIVASLQPENTYRWVRKVLRVVITN